VSDAYECQHSRIQIDTETIQGGVIIHKITRVETRVYICQGICPECGHRDRFVMSEDEIEGREVDEPSWVKNGDDPSYDLEG